MIKKWFGIVGLFLAIAFNASSQNTSDIILQIGDEKIPAEEFWAIYQKNSQVNPQSKKTSLDEYLDLFINFKLKVKEAKDAKMDTAAAFQKELNGYRKQLAKSYLVIEEVNDETVREVYDRMHTNVRASHILLRLPENASPSDTLKVYQKAMKIRNSILQKEISFADAAVQYSEDPSARNMDMGNGRPPRIGNKGDLGYFGVFDMVFPFEEAVYHLQKGEISNPVRTRFGYHLIYLTDKIPAIGEVKAAHIFIKHSAPSDADTAKLRIDELSNEIKKGKAFEEIALRYSDDKGSSDKGGELPLFGANRMVPQIIAAISKMKIGEISEPVKTNFGWHIIKFIDQKPIEDFDKVKTDIKEKLKRDTRSRKGEQAKIAQIKAEENFKEYRKNLSELISTLDSNFYSPEYHIESASVYTEPIFSLRDSTYTQYDFLKYLYARKGSGMPGNFTELTKQIYQEYVDQLCLNFEERHLEEKYLDFRLLMNEYRDGILLFDLMDKKVWSKASSDTLGLKQYFANHQKKYRWNKRAQISVFHLNNKSYADSVQQLLALGKTDQQILDEMKTDSLIPVRLEKLNIEKGSNSEYNTLKWKRSAVYPILDENGEAKSIVVFRDFMKPTNKKLNETRGMLISDYQDQLEKEWIVELKKRYELKIDKAVLRQLKERVNE